MFSLLIGAVKKVLVKIDTVNISDSVAPFNLQMMQCIMYDVGKCLQRPESCDPKFLVKNRTLAPECMTDKHSCWYHFLVPETFMENLGRVPWA